MAVLAVFTSRDLEELPKTSGETRRKNHNGWCLVPTWSNYFRQKVLQASVSTQDDFPVLLFWNQTTTAIFWLLQAAFSCWVQLKVVSAVFFSLSVEALKLGWRSSDKLGHIFSVDFFSVAGSVTNFSGMLVTWYSHFVLVHLPMRFFEARQTWDDETSSHDWTDHCLSWWFHDGSCNWRFNAKKDENVGEWQTRWLKTYPEWYACRHIRNDHQWMFYLASMCHPLQQSSIKVIMNDQQNCWHISSYIDSH